MNCVICESEIPAARLEVAPATLTCSRDCSDQKAKLTRRAAAQRWRDKTKAKKKKGTR